MICIILRAGPAQPRFPSGQCVLLYACEVISSSWQRTVTAVYSRARRWLIPCCIHIVRVNILIVVVVSLKDICILLCHVSASPNKNPVQWTMFSSCVLDLKELGWKCMRKFYLNTLEMCKWDKISRSLNKIYFYSNLCFTGLIFIWECSSFMYINASFSAALLRKVDGFRILCSSREQIKEKRYLHQMCHLF